MTSNEKYKKLIEYLKCLGSVAVAFSGGVDSTFLMAAAKEALGENAIAVTCCSNFFPNREIKEAEDFCKEQGICHHIFYVDELKVKGIAHNPPNRCYLCKKNLFTKIKEIAYEYNISYIAEGSNIDDNRDYRPGMIAIKELEITSPLRYAEMTKADIRELSKKMGLKTWNKQSFACLASRFVYGEAITVKKLKMVDKAEQLLIDLGFHQLRVRIHGNIARIEVAFDEFEKVLKNREKIYFYFKEIGFDYVTMDLLGYRTGSMNETLYFKESCEWNNMN